MIDDGFGVVLLPAVPEELRHRFDIGEVVYHRKTNLSAMTVESVLADLDERCRAVVAGVCAWRTTCIMWVWSPVCCRIT